MDYSQLSDFEINKRIAIALNIDMHFFIPESENSFDLEVLPSEMGPIWQTSADMVLQYSPSNCNCFNPCNNPADAWPIIKENMISIGYDGIAWEAFSIKWDVRYSDWRNHPEHPLRVAMILFLMGKEKEISNA